MYTRLIAALLFLAPVSYGATFTVSNPADSGPGTLRQAILDANANPGADQIVWSIFGLVTVTSSLPAITDVVAIDATMPGGQDGVVLGPNSGIGLAFAAGSTGSTATDLRVQNFTTTLHIAAGVTGIVVSSGGFSTALATIDGDNNLLQDTFFGTLQFNGNGNQLLRGTAAPIQIAGDDNRITDAGTGSHFAITTLEIQSSAARTIVEGSTFGNFSLPVAIDVAGAAGATITGNTIFGGYPTGIAVRAPATGIRITGNSISGTAREIDLGYDGATPNDPAPDADTGANQLQNFPVLARAVLFPASRLVVSGTLTSAPLTPYLIDFFASPSGDPGATEPLGSTVVTTDATGTATFVHAITSPLPAPDRVITATATNQLTNDTSELSAAIDIFPPSQVGFAATSYSVDENGGAVTVVVERTGNLGNPVTVAYTTENGSAVAPGDYAATSGTLIFAPGDQSETIVIPIVADAVPEGAETFDVRLSDPSAFATLGTALTTVTINAQAAPVPVPTLSEWSLLLLIAGLAMAMMLRAR